MRGPDRSIPEVNVIASVLLGLFISVVVIGNMLIPKEPVYQESVSVEKHPDCGSRKIIAYKGVEVCA